MSNLYCRVCGYKNSEPPWGEDDESPDWDICPCCGVETGYEDVILSTIRLYRERWLADGAKWLDRKEKPSDWDLAEQMKNIPPQFL